MKTYYTMMDGDWPLLGSRENCIVLYAIIIITIIHNRKISCTVHICNIQYYLIIIIYYIGGNLIPIAM